MNLGGLSRPTDCWRLAIVGPHRGDLSRWDTYPASEAQLEMAGRVTVSTAGTSKKGRIGLIVPSSNTVVEMDFFRHLPAKATLHTARMFLAETTAEAERIMVTEYVPQALVDIASVQPQVVAFACTSAGAVLGAEGEARLIGEISQVTGAAVVSTNDAVGSCIERHDPRSVAVITPYVDELNAHIQSGLERRGLRITGIWGLGLTDNLAIGSVSPDEIVEFAGTVLVGLDVELLFVSCTNFRALDARERLARRFGVPVVTSNQATIDAVIEVLDLGTSRQATFVG
jgi:maleate isomerase